MAYSTVSKKSGETYYLHSKQVTLKGGRSRPSTTLPARSAAMPWTTCPAAIRSSRASAPGFLF